ncbi:hypothetical protein Tco_1013255 [Tanacetum coccineum]
MKMCPKSGLGESLIKGIGRKPRRNHYGIKIKVSMPGSASAGVGSTNGKCVSSVPMDDEISNSSDYRTTLKIDITLEDINGNDGCDNTSKGVGGNASCNHAGSRDGIAIAKTGIVEGMTRLNSSLEHTGMEDVVNTSAVLTSNLDGITSNKGGYGFEFGKNNLTIGIFKKPIVPLFKVQFSESYLLNPFAHKSYTADANRFAEKLKQCSKEMALKMEYTPGVVSKLENGN